MADPLPPIPDNIADIAGPLLIGYLLNWGLFGALCVQVYNYYVSFPNDGRISKAVVYGVFALEIAQTLIVTRDCFRTYAQGFGNMNALNDIQTIWLSAPILIGTISCTVQLYYAYRVYVLSQSKILVLAIGLVSLLQYSSALAQGVQAHNLGLISELTTKAFVSCSLWLAGSAACDIMITCSMAYLLLRRGNNQIRHTHSMIVKLVRLIVETGVVTATTATIDIILFLKFPNNPFHTTTTFALAKLYSNSLLVLFNNRTHLQRAADNLSFSLTNSSGGSRAPPINTNANRAHVRNTIQIQQTTYVETDAVPLQDIGTKKPHSLFEA